ncbi:hypothetical protein RMR10_012075 [Agrobacterium rosae]|uniref:hypothetical protein n=1 Tax=Agrobacterium rosae TaxID=1972867 RepID=UPI002A0DAB6E|nr:hypothetical protein [Agrobacterium rosae]MDX8313366.1 hypothetical protein [Agrobacterium rosae]
MIKPIQPYSFDPSAPALTAIFSEWAVTYIGQAKMDDDNAEPFQEPLAKLETAASALPFASMQDFFHQQTIQSCLGSMCSDLDADQRDAVYALAIAESDERKTLLAMIYEHQTKLKATEALDAEDDGDMSEVWENARAELGQRENSLLMTIASYPAISIDNIVLKGRYLAALHANHALGYEFAEAFVESFAELGRASA